MWLTERNSIMVCKRMQCEFLDNRYIQYILGDCFSKKHVNSPHSKNPMFIQFSFLIQMNNKWSLRYKHITVHNHTITITWIISLCLNNPNRVFLIGCSKNGYIDVKSTYSTSRFIIGAACLPSSAVLFVLLAINRCVCRSFTHVRTKVSKSPSLSNGYNIHLKNACTCITKQKPTIQKTW